MAKEKSRKRSRRRGRRSSKRGPSRKSGMPGWVKIGLELAAGMLVGDLIEAAGLIPVALSGPAVGVIGLSLISSKGRMPSAPTIAAAGALQVTKSVERTSTFSKVKVQAVSMAKEGKPQVEGGGGGTKPKLTSGDLNDLIREAGELKAAGSQFDDLVNS